jgi:heptosyltransferase-2
VRLLVVMPSWVGDAVMATPALRLLRSSLPGSYIGALCRPGIDEILAGSDFFDEVHIERATGVMAPKHAAAKVRPRRYEAALLLTNSFSTALVTRLAGSPKRIGYNRDGRGVMLTQKLEAPKRADGRWAPIPAVSYYIHAARAMLNPTTPALLAAALPADARMELVATPQERAAAEEILTKAGIGPDDMFAILNPGGNNPAKRWPPDRFAAVGEHLASRHRLRILVSGSPGEADLCADIAGRCGARSLASLGVRLGSLKAIVRRSRLMVTNDTGPRHIAAAFGVPVVSLFGPTDPRWTTIPAPAGEAVLVADPTLPESEVSDDHPERCRIERITIESVVEAADRLLAQASGRSRV